jgi:hypothetical protein
MQAMNNMNAPTISPVPTTLSRTASSAGRNAMRERRSIGESVRREADAR